jgi:hypothetical protein
MAAMAAMPIIFRYFIFVSFHRRNSRPMGGCCSNLLSVSLIS